MDVNINAIKEYLQLKWKIEDVIIRDMQEFRQIHVVITFPNNIRICVVLHKYWSAEGWEDVIDSSIKDQIWRIFSNDY